MKGKIGQVTLYDYNYGSALQCYATQQVVRSLGYDCVLLRQRYNSELRGSCAISSKQFQSQPHTLPIRRSSCA